MTIAVELFGTDRNVPETGERGWGDDVTDLLVTLAEAVDATVSNSTTPSPRLASASASLAALGTLTPTAATMLVSGTPGAVTLSATTAIADGPTDGQLLLILGGANAVTIPDGANTSLNGPATLTQDAALLLRWSDSLSRWIEISRSN